MKIGVCIGDRLNDAVKAKEFGYDYVETNCQAIAKMDNDTLDKFRNIGIPVYAGCVFIGHRVVGKEKDDSVIDEYLNRLFSKADFLGIKCMVFGSSGARRMKPEDGLTADETRAQIALFLKNKVAPLCEKFDIRVVIEPLRPEECNVINTVPQAIEIAETVGSDYIGVLADVKHMMCSDDPLADLAGYGKYLWHGHTSNPFPDPSLDKKRIYPKSGDEFNQDDFFIPMIKAGVEHISIEADLIDFDTDAREAIKVLNKYR